jgi:uracil-DNA glycosylase
VELQLLHTQIRACEKCVTAGFLPKANPLVLGTPNAQFFLIGQAPSRTDDITGEFYQGPAGKKLRGWLMEAGFSGTDFGTLLYAAAITKCFPGRNAGSSKDRLPSKSEQKLCRTWLDQELEIINPHTMILFGGLAIKTFLSSDPLETLIGQVFEKDGRTYIPLPHSSGASTWLNVQEHQELLSEAIQAIKTIKEAKANTPRLREEASL